MYSPSFSYLLRALLLPSLLIIRDGDGVHYGEPSPSSEIYLYAAGKRLAVAAKGTNDGTRNLSAVG